MIILRTLRIVFALTGFAILAFVGHAYYTTQHSAAFDTGVQSKFVGRSGSVDRMGETAPTFVESTRVFFMGLLGKEDGPKSDLASLRKRQAYNAKSASERQMDSAMAEMEFWGGMMSKLGFSGP